MKKKGSKCDYIQQRNAEIYTLFQNLISQQHNKTLLQIAQIIVNSPASRFWVSEERATTIISKLERNETITYMHPNAQQKFLHIFQQYKLLRQQNKKTSKQILISQVIYNKAPQFFITPESAIIFFNNERLRRRNKTKK